SQYLYKDRQAREERCLRQFGKEGDTVDGRPVARPRRAVLVSTQIIEQSLDLDFDLMITELAPVDLILQRAGRLHRHNRPDRPASLSRPQLWILEPDTKDNGSPHFGGSAYVYDPHVLLRSFLALKQNDRTTVAVPDDVEPLVEAVYEDRDCPEKLPEHLRDEWQRTRSAWKKRAWKDSVQAQVHLISDPIGEDNIIEDFNVQLEEDDPSVNLSLQALTRLSRPTLSVICLYGTDEEAYLDSGHSQPVNLTQVPDQETIRMLLANSIRISGKPLIDAIYKHGAQIRCWARCALLRHGWLFLLDDQSHQSIGDFEVRIDATCGLVVKKIV
ncbi:MAG: hypothetical protein HQ592_08700, partial [Planctomycetes bacterium]|nr:hypothetical protein [Planctomycetota bacterium]